MKYINYKNVFLAISAFSLSFGFSKHIGLENFYVEAFFVAFSCYFIYSLPNVYSYKKSKIPFIISSLLLVFLTISSFFVIHTIYAFLILFISFFVSFFYVSSFSFLKISIREIPFFKSIFIAFSWVSLCIIFPQLNAEKINFDYVLTFGNFFFFLALTIPFDIRDFDFDKSQIKTVVGQIGVTKSKVLAASFLLIFCVLNARQFNNDYLLFFTGIYLTVLIFFASVNFKHIFFELLLDASIIFLGFSYFLT